MIIWWMPDKSQVKFVWLVLVSIHDIDIKNNVDVIRTTLSWTARPVELEQPT